MNEQKFTCIRKDIRLQSIIDRIEEYRLEWKSHVDRTGYSPNHEVKKIYQIQGLSDSLFFLNQIHMLFSI